MKNLLNFLSNITLSEIEKLKNALGESKICKSMNEPEESEITNKDGETEIRIYLNPHNQKCFNYGYFTYQDFYDWLGGGGVIVKGNSEDEKRKFWEVAVFEQQHDYGWAVGYNLKHFKLIDETFKIEWKSDRGYSNYPKNPLKITTKNHAEIIAKVFGDISRYYSDTELTHESNMNRKIDGEISGAKQTLFMLGIGYYGACNTPEDPLNLSWIGDICKYKAVYLYFVKNGIELPDFDFVYKHSKGLI